jgi:opacity protein-like surface antigen
MNEHLFDQYFRTKLQDHQAEVPADMWSRIIQEKPKRRPFLFWLNTRLSILITGCLLISSVGYLFYPNIQSLLQQSSETTQAPFNNQAQQKLTKDLYTESSSKERNIQIETPLIAQTNSGITKSQPASTNTSTTSQQTKKSPQKQSSNMFSVVTEPVLYTTDETTKDVSTQLGESDAGFTTADLWRFNSNNQLRAPFLLSGIQGIGKPIDCPTTGRARIRNDWYAEVYFSPEYTTKRINGTNLPLSYLSRKDSSESMRGGFTAGMGISANIGEHLLFRTGIQYAQINERFAMRLENERRTITVITTRPLVRAPGDTIYVSDTSTMQQIGYLTRKTQNRYRSIEIPLILGYEWGNEQIKFSINAGVIATATSWYSGEILDTTNQIVALSSKGQSSIYQQQIGLSGFGSIRISKPIRPGLEVYAEPFFRTTFSSMQIRQPAFTQRFSSTGIQLGVKWKLN